MSTPRYGNRRANCPGYLEFIWRVTPDLPEGVTPQAVAYITDVYGTPRKPWYCAAYGIHVIEGPTVAAVKEELFALLDADA
jgi:hypothetical protein